MSGAKGKYNLNNNIGGSRTRVNHARGLKLVQTRKLNHFFPYYNSLQNNKNILELRLFIFSLVACILETCVYSLYTICLNVERS